MIRAYFSQSLVDLLLGIVVVSFVTPPVCIVSVGCWVVFVCWSFKPMWSVWYLRWSDVPSCHETVREHFYSVLLLTVTSSDSERFGAEEAHGAHNPGVGGSKPLSAITFCFFVRFWPCSFCCLLLAFCRIVSVSLDDTSLFLSKPCWFSAWNRYRFFCHIAGLYRTFWMLGCCCFFIF